MLEIRFIFSQLEHFCERKCFPDVTNSFFLAAYQDCDTKCSPFRGEKQQNGSTNEQKLHFNNVGQQRHGIHVKS